MRKCYLAVLILYLSNHLCQCSANDDFVDPLDMLNYDQATKSMKRPKTKSGSEPIQINDRCTVFLSRFINVLLKTTGLDNVNRAPNGDDELNSYASVTISVGDLDALKNMVTKKDIDYVEIDRILNKMFAPSKDIPKFQQTNGFLEMNMEIKELLYWISIGCIALSLLYTVYYYFFYWFSISFVLFVGFMLAFASTWYTMYMKAEINRSVHLEYMPTHCYKNTGHGWFSWFSNKQNLDDCKKYKEAIHLNPKYSIALTEVLAEMVSKIMVKPVESMGEAIYGFNNTVLQDFPFWAKLIFIPILIVIIIKTMMVSIALLVGRYVSTKSIFGHGSTTIGPEQTHSNKSTENNKTDNSIPQTASGQYAFAQKPEIPNVNFNINLYHPSSSENNMKKRNKCIDNEFKKKESNYLSMLKNKDNDCVDALHKLRAKNPRSRTLSF